MLPVKEKPQKTSVSAKHHRIRETFHSFIFSGPFGASIYLLKAAFEDDEPKEVTITVEWSKPDKENNNAETK